MSTKKRWDADLIKMKDPFHSILTFIMPVRTDAEVSSTVEFDITDLNAYLEKRNKKLAEKKYKLFHAICTAVARTIYHRPQMNVFISGRNYYMRKDITLSFVARQKFEDKSQETLMFLKVKPEMNFDVISGIINGDVKKARSEKGNDLDKSMSFVGNLPRWVKEILFFILRRLEYHGMYPKSLAAGDPNYSTCLLSNLGSIGASSCYHHLTNFGTNSMIITIGKIHEKIIKGKKRNFVDMTFTLDERIADGFYFAKSIKITKYLLENPKKLEEAISDVIPTEVLEMK